MLVSIQINWCCLNKSIPLNLWLQFWNLNMTFEMQKAKDLLHLPHENTVFSLLVVPLHALVCLIILDWWAQRLLQIQQTYSTSCKLYFFFFVSEAGFLHFFAFLASCFGQSNTNLLQPVFLQIIYFCSFKLLIIWQSKKEKFNSNSAYVIHVNKNPYLHVCILLHSSKCFIIFLGNICFACR